MIKVTLEQRERYEAPLCETMEMAECGVLCASIEDWEYDDDSFND